MDITQCEIIIQLVLEVKNNYMPKYACFVLKFYTKIWYQGNYSFILHRRNRCRIYVHVSRRVEFTYFKPVQAVFAGTLCDISEVFVR